MRPGFNHARENAPSGRVFTPRYDAARHSAVMRSGFNHAGEKRAFRASVRTALWRCDAPGFWGKQRRKLDTRSAETP